MNMKKMIYFEFKKVFERKFNVVAMIAGYILILVCVGAFIKDHAYFDEKTGSYIYGLQTYKMSEEKENALTDYLTEDYMTQLSENIQSQNIPLNTDDGYMQVVAPIREILWVLCDNYMDAREKYVNWNIVNEIPTEGGIHFYERRIEKVEEFLNMDFTYGNYSEEEKAYWLEMEQKVQTPFKWGDKDCMDEIWDIIQIAFYFFFVIAICISPVFAAEYESGAAALLLTTKNGKRKLSYAKILVVVLFSLLYTIVGIGLGVFIEVLAAGFHGADLPVQLWKTTIPYNWTVGKACVVSLAMMLLVVVTLALFTALLSSRVKSGMITLVLIGPAFLPMSKESGLWNHINYLFPIRAVGVKDMIKVFNSYQFGNLILSYLTMAVTVYIVISIISLFGIKNGFAKHQVKA